MRHENRYQSLRKLRQDAHKLFREVMDPGLESDNINNPPLELAEPPPEPDNKKRPYLDELTRSSFESVETRQDASEDNPSARLPGSSPEEGV
jgi:hypothetical protein